MDFIFNEGALLMRVAAGDEHAFRQLFHYYKKKIYTIALKITRSEIKAEELLQDVFLIIWMKREHLKEIEDFQPYLSAITRYESYRAIKTAAKEKKRKEQFNDLEIIYTHIEEKISIEEFNTFLHTAINRLSPQQQQVYKLIKEQGLTREQTAEVMQLSPQTVKTHLAKAMKMLRAYFIANFENITLIIITLFML